MNSTAKIFWVIILVIALLGLWGSLFTVSEGQEALVTRLGKLQTTKGEATVYKPGLHFKLPIVSDDFVFDTRIQTLDIESSRIVTAEKKDVLVDYYVKWRINNLAQYYKTTGGDATQAEVLLQQQLNNGLRAQFGQRTISEVVSGERSQVMSNLRQTADKSAQPLGIDIVDVRIKAIDLPNEVSTAVFERMRAERQRVASEHRANGKSIAEAIRAKADADVTVTLAKASQKAASVRAAGDTKAAIIYNKAYSKSPSFYAFYKSISAYPKVFNSKQDVMVVGPDSEFFKYMKNTGNK